MEACGCDEYPKYLVRDRDGVFGHAFTRCVATLGILDCPIAPQSPWQDAYVERVIGSIRRDCLDHVVVLSERQLAAIVRDYVRHYNVTRTHLSLAKDAPDARRVSGPEEGKIIAVPRVGGLHHEYQRLEA